MIISTIVVNFNRRDLLVECLLSLEVAGRQIVGSSELIVVDNGSVDESVQAVRERFPAVKLISLEANTGFSGGLNAGLEEARGEWIALINNDATVHPAAFAAMLDAAVSAPHIGSVGAQMRFMDQPDIINSAGIDVDALGIAFDRLVGRRFDDPENRAGEVFGVSGGAALYRRAMLSDIGGFDGSFFAFLEDVDVAWRARMAGWSSVYVPSAVVYHHHSATAGAGSPRKYYLVGRNRVRLIAKNATGRQLAKYGVLMLLYDAAYVAYVAAVDHTLAPLQGRLRGLSEWRRYRREGCRFRTTVPLSRPHGLRGALRRRSAWAGRISQR